MLKELLIEKTPKYTDILPYSQKRVTYRPFVVREEKNLILAKQTSSFENLLVTVQDVVNSCCSGLPDDDCKNLPFCDLEYLFLKIREKSVGELIPCIITCPETGERVETTVDISSIKLSSKKVNTKIKLDNNLLLVMTIPTLDTYLKLSKFENQDEEEILKLLALSIKEVQSGEETLYGNDLPIQELIDFVNELTAKQFKMVLNFLTEIPTVEQNVKYATKDNIERTTKLRGFSDFLELCLVTQI